MTFLTCLSRADIPFVFDFLNGVNTGEDFAEFTRFLLGEGYLVDGDIYVMDNAAVHLTEETIHDLMVELGAAGVLRLPTSSSSILLPLILLLLVPLHRLILLPPLLPLLLIHLPRVLLLRCLLHLQVRVVFLPAYSPELNPCELCFADIKRYLRTHSDRYRPLPLQIMEAMLSVTRAKLLRYYLHCIAHSGGRYR
jgi:hypothetical protein